MSIVVNTNIASMNAQRSLVASGKELQEAMQRLSTGAKINSAADDAAGFAIAENMTAQVRGLTMSAKNASDALGLLKVIENASNDVTDMLQRVRELAVQAKSGTNSAGDINNLQLEANALMTEITRVSTDTTYNGKARIGADAAVVNIQIGYKDGDQIEIETHSVSSASLGLDTTANLAANKILLNAEAVAASLAAGGAGAAAIATSLASGGTGALANTAAVAAYHTDNTTTAGSDATTDAAAAAAGNAAGLLVANAEGQVIADAAGVTAEADATGFLRIDSATALTSISSAIDKVSGFKAEWGAGQNRLGYTVSNLMNVVEFTAAARSRIQDADFAAEAAKLAKAQVLQQTGTAMLAQANAAPQLALQLIK